MEGELVTLAAREAALAAAVIQPRTPAMDLRMAEAFREKATTLAAGLEHDDQRDAARQALRGLLEKIVIRQQVVGNLGWMLDAAQGRVRSNDLAVVNDGCGGTQPTTVG